MRKITAAAASSALEGVVKGNTASVLFAWKMASSFVELSQVCEESSKLGNFKCQRYQAVAR